MAVPNRHNPKIDDAYFPFWNITGRIGHKYRDGALEFAEDGSESAGIKPGIYQRRWNGYNNVIKKPKNQRKMYYIREKYYKPTNPRTSKQQANRAPIARAVQAWQNLSEQERESWREIGRPILKRGVDLFISDYIKNNPQEPIGFPYNLPLALGF